jgi:hypothetical protein
MAARLRHRLVFTWIALAAILMMTFAPSVSRLLAAPRGLDWAPLCSAAAQAAVADASRPQAPASPDGTHAFEHCPFCAVHADLALPPDPRHADARAPVLFRERPLAFLAAPATSWVWSGAQPRAPPFFA